MSLVELRGLTKRYGPVIALRDLDLTIATGTRTAVVGPSGSGKTTLLRLIAGFEKPDAGEIVFDGERISDAAGAVPPHRRNIGLVMQDGALFPHLTVEENVAFGLDRGLPDRRAQALGLMDTVELPHVMAGRRPHELSGGQQQRVALARALARRPRLMLLDEPFSALDSGLREQMRKAVAGILAAAGVTTILVTHDQAEAMSFADHIVILREGTLRQSGLPREVYEAPVDLETAEFLGQAIVLDAVIAGGVATCTLGKVAVRGPDGPATIMLRPEQIVLQPTAGPSDVRLVAIDFAGPTASVVLATSDTTLAFNTIGPGLPPVGSAVTVTIIGSAHVFGGISSPHQG